MDDALQSGVTTRRRFLLSRGSPWRRCVSWPRVVRPLRPAATTAPPPPNQRQSTTTPAAATTAAPAAAAATTAPAAAKPPRRQRPRQRRQQPPGRDDRAGRGQQRRAQGSARSKTLLLAQGGAQGKYLDYDLWNAYALGANHQTGPNLTHEPLAFYSAYGDKEYLWLASGYEYSPDFKQLTIKLRSGIKWSDGEPFSADDVVYTLSSLKDLGCQGALGRRHPAGSRQRVGDRCQHSGRQIQGARAAVLRPADVQVRHRRLHRAEAHLFGQRRLGELQVLRSGQGVAGDHRAVEGRRGLRRAEGLRSARRAGGQSQPV